MKAPNPMIAFLISIVASTFNLLVPAAGLLHPPPCLGSCKAETPTYLASDEDEVLHGCILAS